jgi:hypothetical protein
LSLKADDTLQQLLARNEPAQQKNMLFLAEFGRYLEAVEKQPVYVCEKCLDVRLAPEKSDAMLCFRSDDPHAWKEFTDKETPGPPRPERPRLRRGRLGSG